MYTLATYIYLGEWYLFECLEKGKIKRSHDLFLITTQTEMLGCTSCSKHQKLPQGP